MRAQLEDDTYDMQNRQMPGSVENAEIMQPIHKHKCTTYSNMYDKT